MAFKSGPLLLVIPLLPINSQILRFGSLSLDAELQKLLLLFRLCQAPTCWILCYTLIFLWAENWVRYLGIAALKGLEFRQCSWQDGLNCTLESHLIGTQVCLLLLLISGMRRFGYLINSWKKALLGGSGSIGKHLKLQLCWGYKDLWQIIFPLLPSSQQLLTSSHVLSGFYIQPQLYHKSSCLHILLCVDEKWSIPILYVDENWFTSIFWAGYGCKVCSLCLVTSSRPLITGNSLNAPGPWLFSSGSLW